MLIIDHSTKLRYFNNCHSVSCDYKFNKKACMSKIFNGWLVQFDKEIKAKKKKRKIIHMIDPRDPVYSHYSVKLTSQSIHTQYFLPNCTSLLRLRYYLFYKILLHRTFFLNKYLATWRKARDQIFGSSQKVNPKNNL